MSHLQGGKVNVSLIQESARKHLMSLLGKCEGTKAIVWDKELAGPIGLIAKYSLLKEHEVNTMFPLLPEKIPLANVNHIIFISRPKIHLMNWIAENVHNEGNNSKQKTPKQFHLFYVPAKTSLCEKELMNRGMFGSLQHQEDFKCLLFPYDNDLITLELQDCFRFLNL